MLELPILGLLQEEPLHGYELKKRLDETLGLWGVSFGSLYPALARLEAAGEPLVLRLPALATSLSPLRERLRRWLVATGADSREAADVLLAVGEAASNAIEHAVEPDPAAIVVTASGMDGDGATVRVRDHGRWDDEPSAPHRGRGMQIMRAIAGDVAVDRSPDGTTVTIHHRKGDTAA
jgi:anti-sigma regulatory factor (Ser/Thr protein kinase)